MSHLVMGSPAVDRVLGALAGLEGAFFLRDEQRAFFGAFPVELSAAIDPEPALARDGRRSDHPRWVGLLPYEAFRAGERDAALDSRAPALIERPLWARYEAVGVLDESGEVRLVGEARAAARLEAALGSGAGGPRAARLRMLEDEERAGCHGERIRIALEEIRRGNLYQVNLARRSTFAVEGAPSALLAALGSQADAPYAASLDLAGLGVVSVSPELCLHWDVEGRVKTRPIKGTRPRSSDAGEDARFAVELSESEKEQAELTMVIDIERNDLGRFALPGSVRLVELPQIVAHPTVFHREATVEAQLPMDLSRTPLLSSFLPSGSVTGAPKLRAMELIARTEAHRRGLYTGALGYLAHSGELKLSMAIRVLCTREGVGHYFAGGGIVADSVADLEIEETRWKSSHLAQLIEPLPDAVQGRGLAGGEFRIAKN